MNLSDSPACDMCSSGMSGDLAHALTECNYNLDLDPNLLNVDMSGRNIVSFNLQLGNS